jgi:hypothetical protein|tara:strand:- start:1613 stop:1831 length:219 start_codon:yes stop_codon:yes gene_type:complete
MEENLIAIDMSNGMTYIGTPNTTKEELENYTMISTKKLLPVNWGGEENIKRYHSYDRLALREYDEKKSFKKV